MFTITMKYYIFCEFGCRVERHPMKLSPRGTPLCWVLAGRYRSLPFPAPPSWVNCSGTDTTLIAANFGASSWRRKISPAGSDSPREAHTAQQTAYMPPLLCISLTPLFPTLIPPQMTQTSPFSPLCLLPVRSPQMPLPCIPQPGQQPHPGGCRALFPRMPHAGFHAGSMGLQLPRDTRGRVFIPWVRVIWVPPTLTPILCTDKLLSLNRQHLSNPSPLPFRRQSQTGGQSITQHRPLRRHLQPRHEPAAADVGPAGRAGDPAGNYPAATERDGRGGRGLGWRGGGQVGDPRGGVRLL